VTAANPVRAALSPWRSVWLSWFLPCSGICVALFGVLIAVAWYAHWEGFVRGGAGLPAMKINVALCFVLCGVAVALMTTRRKPAAIALSAIAVAIVVWTLEEYGSGRNFGLDELLLHDYLTPANSFPGRMSPMTAVSFVFIGTGLALSGLERIRAWHLATAGLLACLVGVIAMVSLGGFLAGMEAAYGWERYTRMAVHTAAGLWLLSLALLAWVWEVSDRREINLARWLPLAGAVTLMAVVALLAVVSLRELRNSYQARRSSYEALVASQGLLGDLMDTLRGLRAYVLSGEAGALAPYQSGTEDIPRTLATLATLVRDNGAEQRLEQPLAEDLHAVIAYSQRLIALRYTLGLQPAIGLAASGEGRIVVDRVRFDLQAFTDEVHRLVLERDTEAERNYRHTVALLVVASAVAAMLLGFAHVAVSREVARRRRIEARLQELSAFQAAILDSANYAITSTNLDGRVTSFNATAERWLGYDAADVIGKSTPLLWHDADEFKARVAEIASEFDIPASGKMDVFGTYLSRGSRYESEWTFRRRDDTRFPVWLSMAALNNSGGSPIGYLGVFEDITERKRNDAQLRLSEERFRRAFDDAPIGMALVTPEQGRWLRVNAALCNMLGYSEQELMERNQPGITHPDDMDKDQTLVREVLDGKIPSFQIESRYLHQNGAVVFVNLSVSLVRSPEGVALYFVSQIENITQRHEMDRMKREFIATVSHELRTPLTSIRGSLGLIAGGAMGAMPEKITPMVMIALQNCERLVLIINDILDMEKIEAGKSQLQVGCVAVAALLRQAVAMNEAFAAKFNVTLLLEAPLPSLQVLADPDRLMQVLTNLLSNAAKFSPPGASVRLRALSDDKQVRFEVEDDGSGIPEAFRARVFEKFAQADSSSGRRFGGTGLGLAISKSLVEQMDGRIYFESRAGGGTVFFVELPGVGAESASLPVVQLTDTARIRLAFLDTASLRALDSEALPRLLHIEDDNDLSTVLQAALAGRAEVVIARTLQAAQRLLQEQRFSAVLLDPGLPDGDGLALLDQIERIAPRPPPVLILSVIEMSREIRGRVAGAFVKSRIAEIDLAATILSVIHDSAAAAPAPHLAA
jgi:PAS domain S-box-containing protein